MSSPKKPTLTLLALCAIYVCSQVQATVAPVLNISLNDTDFVLSWDDTQSFDLHHSNDLSVWTNTNVNTSPHSTALLNPSEFSS